MEEMNTPWGNSDGQETLAEGIVSYSTPSHGGIHLSLERQKSIPAGVKNFLGSFQWWEEDCDWAIPYYIFREDIRAYGKAYHFEENLAQAVRTIVSCHPEYKFLAEVK